MDHASVRPGRVVDCPRDAAACKITMVIAAAPVSSKPVMNKTLNAMVSGDIAEEMRAPVKLPSNANEFSAVSRIVRARDLWVVVMRCNASVTAGHPIPNTLSDSSTSASQSNEPFMKKA